jgi:hypothetical protein
MRFDEDLTAGNPSRHNLIQSMTDSLLILNAGSSSLKFSVFRD